MVLLRPFNTYGPRQSARAVIPTVITQIAAGCREIKLGATHPTRDFLYVSDTVAGFVQALHCNAAIGEAINIASGFEISIGQAANLIAELMGADIEIVADPQRLRPADSEVERLFGSTDKAQKLFDWAPEYADIEGFRQGLSATIEWFRRPGQLSRYKVAEYNI